MGGGYFPSFSMQEFVSMQADLKLMWSKVLNLKPLGIPTTGRSSAKVNRQ
jgi:hypothetical protein